MNKYTNITLSVLCASTLSSMASSIVTGNMVVNKFFLDGGNADYTYWNTSGSWQTNGDESNLKIDFSNAASTNQWSVATTSLAGGGVYDLTKDSSITSIEGYDPNTAKFTDFSWKAGHYFLADNVGSRGSNLNAQFKLELDIVVDGGTYRMQSENIEVSANNLILGPHTFETNAWRTGGAFLGNPFEGDDGIVLADVDDIQFKLVMFTGSDNNDGSDVFTYKIDNVGFNYELTVAAVPEPSSMALLSLGGLGFALRRRR